MTQASPRAPAILVVEDDADLQSVLRRILEGEGYRVLRAEDGDQGVATALDFEPQLVILDVGLPGKDGHDVARELRARGFQAPMLDADGAQHGVRQDHAASTPAPTTIWRSPSSTPSSSRA